VIALGGVWLINHLDNAPLRMPTWLQASEQTSSPPNQSDAPQPHASPSGTPPAQ
jgi:hypothetical protein